VALNPAWTLDSEAPEVVESADVVVKVRQALLTLREREERAIRLRYFESATYQEIGDALDVGVERARQITEKALRKLKHPSRSRTLLAAFVGTLPCTSAMPPAKPAIPPSEAQELALRLRELQAHIEETKQREARSEARIEARGKEWWRDHLEWHQPRAKRHPTMGEARCLIRIVRTVMATTDGESVILHPGEMWAVDEQHRDDLVALGYAVSA
jgi:hypothetical protein